MSKQKAAEEFDASELDGLDDQTGETPIEAEGAIGAEAGQEEPVKKAAPEAEPTEGEGEGAKSATITAAEQAKSYKYRGKEYSVEQLVELGLLEDVLTTAEQFPHLQKKYTDTLEAMRGAASRPTADAASAPTAGPTAEQIEQAYAPVIKATVEGKVFGEEMAVFAETWPSVFAQMLFVRDQSLERVARLEQQFYPRMERERNEQAVKVVEGVNTTLDELAKEDFFKGFADPKVRQEFHDRIANDFANLPSTILTPDFITRQAAAFLYPALKDALAAKTGQPAKTGSRRPRVTGEGGGARPTPQIEDELEKAFRELDEA